MSLELTPEAWAEAVLSREYEEVPVINAGPLAGAELQQLVSQPLLLRGLDTLADTDAALGLTSLPASLRLPALSRSLGTAHPVQQVDIGTRQRASNSTLGQVVKQMRRGQRAGHQRRVEVGLGGSAWQQVAPGAVAALDLAAMAAPEQAGGMREPTRVLWASPGAHADFEQPVAGAGAWYQVREGALVVLLAPASTSNIQSYWEHKEGGQQGTLLVDQLTGRLRAELAPGDTLIIPPGWLHAWLAPQEVVALHGSFLTAASLVLHLVVADTAADSDDPTWPDFPGLMWAAAGWLLAHQDTARSPFQVFSWQRALASKAGTQLVSFLRATLDSGAPPPPAVVDPTAFLQQLEDLQQRGAGAAAQPPAAGANQQGPAVSTANTLEQEADSQCIPPSSNGLAGGINQQQQQQQDEQQEEVELEEQGMQGVEPADDYSDLPLDALQPPELPSSQGGMVEHSSGTQHQGQASGQQADAPSSKRAPLERRQPSKPRESKRRRPPSLERGAPPPATTPSSKHQDKHGRDWNVSSRKQDRVAVQGSRAEGSRADGGSARRKELARGRSKPRSSSLERKPPGNSSRSRSRHARSSSRHQGKERHSSKARGRSSSRKDRSRERSKGRHSSRSQGRHRSRHKSRSRRSRSRSSSRDKQRSRGRSGSRRGISPTHRSNGTAGLLAAAGSDRHQTQRDSGVGQGQQQQQQDDPHGDFDSDLEGFDMQLQGSASPAGHHPPPSVVGSRARQPGTAKQDAASKVADGRQRKAAKVTPHEPEVDPEGLVALGRGVSSRADELTALLAATQTAPSSAAAGQRLLCELRDRLTMEQRRLAVYRRQQRPGQDTLQGPQRTVDQLTAAIYSYSSTLHLLAPDGGLPPAPADGPGGSRRSPATVPTSADGTVGRAASSRSAPQEQQQALFDGGEEAERDLFMSPTWEEGTPLHTGDEAVRAARRERWQQRQASLGSRRERSPPGREQGWRGGRREEPYRQRRHPERAPQRPTPLTATPGWRAARTAAAHVDAQLSECVIGVLEPIWTCRAPGDSLDWPQRGPLTMRELHLLLTQGRLPPDTMLFDLEGDLSVRLSDAIQVHTEGLTQLPLNRDRVTRIPAFELQGEAPVDGPEENLAPQGFVLPGQAGLGPGAAATPGPYNSWTAADTRQPHRQERPLPPQRPWQDGDRGAARYSRAQPPAAAGTAAGATAAAAAVGVEPGGDAPLAEGANDTWDYDEPQSAHSQHPHHNHTEASTQAHGVVDVQAAGCRGRQAEAPALEVPLPDIPDVLPDEQRLTSSRRALPVQRAVQPLRVSSGAEGSIAQPRSAAGLQAGMLPPSGARRPPAAATSGAAQVQQQQQWAGQPAPPLPDSPPPPSPAVGPAPGGPPPLLAHQAAAAAPPGVTPALVPLGGGYSTWIGGQPPPPQQPAAAQPAGMGMPVGAAPSTTAHVQQLLASLSAQGVLGSAPPAAAAAAVAPVPAGMFPSGSAGAAALPGGWPSSSMYAAGGQMSLLPQQPVGGYMMGQAAHPLVTLPPQQQGMLLDAMGAPMAQPGGQVGQPMPFTGYGSLPALDYPQQGQMLPLQLAPAAQQAQVAPGGLPLEQAVAAGLAAAHMLLHPQGAMAPRPMHPVLHTALQRGLEELRMQQPALQDALTDQEGLRQLAGLSRNQQGTVMVWLKQLNVSGGAQQQVPADWLRKLCAEAQRH